MAISVVVIAFVTGMYATLAHSVGLAVTVCAIGCISFIMGLACFRWLWVDGEGSKGHVMNTDIPEASQVVPEAKPGRSPRIRQTNNTFACDSKKRPKN
ncbi:hypothetical protein CQW23_13427 [Capsicum baccatum]|uniref:Uncharacterized protein n=1 Tax=Capsicum baccatum TaxID=33114 RepID=A0A2G2WVM1_CAPBA|nr:hypothetical protein CQW23_13427 [Capsicum baccatum]